MGEGRSAASDARGHGIVSIRINEKCEIWASSDGRIVLAFHDDSSDCVERHEFEPHEARRLWQAGMALLHENGW